MRLEEIRESVESIKPNVDLIGWTKLSLDLLTDVIDAAIAERALPVTREWMDEQFVGARCDASDGESVWFLPWLRLSILDGVFSVRVAGNPLPVNDFTRGQLLDLLSGLGVRK